MDLTADTLCKVMHSTTLIAGAWINPLLHAMEEFQINTPRRQAAFLAQVAHESLGLKLTRELWGPTKSQVRYERDFTKPWPIDAVQAKLPPFTDNRLAFMLGNSEPGDGKKYAGVGPIQITGRGNLLLCGEALGYALLTYPATLCMPEAGSRSAAWFFKTYACLPLADAGDLVGVRRRVNGGTNGLDETLAFNAAFLKVLA